MDLERQQRRGPASCSCPCRHRVGDGEVDQFAGCVFVGEVPLVLIALRSWRLSASIALVVLITRRTPGPNARNGITCSYAFCQACMITGKRCHHFSSKRSSSVHAASASIAV